MLSVVLEDWQTGTPMPPFLDAMSDAEFWAHAATFEDLRAVFIAAGQKLARYPLGPRGRIRMIRTDAVTFGVDTPDELKAVESLLAADSTLARYRNQ